jgi:hypothetical protein
MTGGLRMEREKRRFTRFPLKMNATLYSNDNSYNSNSLINLSIGGCLIPVEAELAPDTPCSMIICLGSPDSALTIKTEGKIIRSEQGEVAVKFTGVDPDSLFHLQMLARYNSPDSEKIEEEIKNHPGIF